LLVVGHNPGFEDVAKLLASKGEAEALARLTEKYPTAGLAVIAFDITAWTEIAPGTGRLESFVTPKMLS
jgi:phosphohistidine phosphatase